MEWISVNDGLPEIDEDILFMLDYSDAVFRGNYFHDDDYPWAGRSRIHTDLHSFATRAIRCYAVISPPSEREV